MTVTLTYLTVAEARAAGKLKGRIAECGCGKTKPSDAPHLAFQEYLGPGSEYAAITCRHCRFHACAHDPAHMDTLVRRRDGSRARTVVEDGICPGFAPIGPAPKDRFYCGCRGWD